MNVYIVTESWDHEGTYIKKVFTDPKIALLYCRTQIGKDEGKIENLPTGYKKYDHCWIYEEFPAS